MTGKGFFVAFIAAVIVSLVTVIGIPTPDAAGEGWHVPWAAGGARITPDGRLEQAAPEWPRFPVSKVRLWDTRTAWLDLNPAKDVYAWQNLDAHVKVAQEHGVTDITLVLWGTPAWATSRHTSEAAAWMGPSSASPPDRMEDWDTYVEATATRYKGTIKAYEIGNEPNSPLFWNGTSDQLVDMTDRAARIIHRVDPSALVLPAPPIIGDKGIPGRVREYWAGLQQRGTPLDVLSFHYYPDSAAQFKERIPTITSTIRTQYPNLPKTLWLTEVNLPGYSTENPADAHDTIISASQASGLGRIYWYAYLPGESRYLVN